MSATRVANRRTYVFERANGICCWCGVEIEIDPYDQQNGRRYTIEHLRPRMKGGTNDYDNLAAAHSFCNQVRGLIPAEKFPQSWRNVLAEMYSDPSVRTLKECYVAFGNLRRERDCVRF